MTRKGMVAAREKEAARVAVRRAFRRAFATGGGNGEWEWPRSFAVGMVIEASWAELGAGEVRAAWDEEEARAREWAEGVRDTLAELAAMREGER